MMNLTNIILSKKAFYIIPFTWSTIWRKLIYAVKNTHGVTLGEEVTRNGHVGLPGAGHVVLFDLGVVPLMHSFLCALFCMYVVQYCRQISSQWLPVFCKVKPKAL